MAGPRDSRAERLGKRVGIGLLALFVSLPTAVFTISIMRDVWEPPPGREPESCVTGLQALLSAVDDARAAAARGTPGERESLARFRAALEPAWGSRPNLDPLCAGNSRAQGLLHEIDGLRYAEEHAVRYEATGLARQRQRARELSRELLGMAQDGRSR